MERNRVPKGVRTAGQFAPDTRAEAIVSLSATEGDCIPDLIDLTPETQQVLDALRTAGGRPLIVGGAVRDGLLARTRGGTVDSLDIDIEVYGLSKEEVRDALPGDVNEFGQAFGVFNTSLNGQDFDVALPRQDNKTGDGYRGFVVDTDPNMAFETAFARRDFTMNAMGWDAATGELVDPLGGRADLEAGILRHTGDKFDEDPLRVLRGVQFAGRFNMVLAPETAELCQDMAPTFGQLNKDGIWKQFRKLTTEGTHISKALEALHDSGWEKHFPALAATRDVPQDLRWHPEGAVIVHLGLAGDQAAAIARRDGLDAEETSILVLAAMTHDFGKAHSTRIDDTGAITSGGHHETGVEPAREFLNGIGAPGRYHEKILPLIREHMCHTPGGGVEISDTAVRRLLRRLDHASGGPSLTDWARLVEADKAGRGVGALRTRNYVPDWLAVAERLGNETAISTLLKGQHLADAGVPKGKLWAVIVAQSQEAQDEGAFNDEAGARAWLTANEETILGEARRRLQEADAAHALRSAELLAATKARAAVQKAEAKAARAAKKETEQAAAGITTGA
ncbi:metal-dependent phosphohydrolase [Paeniglutamicibacter antarcticus]|uniref:Metal-dependent phosphohydrolase n=1 Tax=Arthrobacter terrae TaxID=2935737 RepID=A0A931CMN5_9MICC|nr:HD domain-containing protein [Arthrobacter terrae]MBG0738980.1 metal-dependent phosphohydrolase [Arthrobacter terrae]